MTPRRSITALAATLALLPACAGAPDVGEAAGAIIGGTKDTADPAVVLLISYPPDQTTFKSCTASAIAPTVLVTAAHCVDTESNPGWSFGVFTGPDASAFPTAATLAPQLAKVKSVHMHPDYDSAPPFHADIGVVILEEAMSAAPIPVNRSAPGMDLVGAPARIVGYGQIVYDEPNAIKYEATTVIAAIGKEDTIVVGDTMKKSCVGDSGGPALVKLDGVETIVGVDSYTDLAGCLEPANYRRTDVYTPFLDEYAPPPAKADAGAGGGGEGGGGGAPPKSSGGDDESGGCAIEAAPREGLSSLAASLLAAATLTLFRRRHPRHTPVSLRPHPRALPRHPPA